MKTREQKANKQQKTTTHEQQQAAISDETAKQTSGKLFSVSKPWACQTSTAVTVLKDNYFKTRYVTH